MMKMKIQMKKNQMHNIILEAINRGIQIALDDFEDIEPVSSVSSNNDVINNNFDSIEERIELEKLVKQLAYYVSISEEDFIRLSKLATKIHYHYKVKDKDELQRIVNFIGSDSYFGNDEHNQELLNVDLNWLDVSNITSMAQLFNSNKFTGDISKWDVSNVKDMTDMFNKSKFNGDISRWDVSNVINMIGMFAFSEFNQDISMWNVENVSHLAQMFKGSKFDQDISTWNFKYATQYIDQPGIRQMFNGSPMDNKPYFWPKQFQPNN